MKILCIALILCMGGLVSISSADEAHLTDVEKSAIRAIQDHLDDAGNGRIEETVAYHLPGHVGFLPGGLPRTIIPQDVQIQGYLELHNERGLKYKNLHLADPHVQMLAGDQVAVVTGYARGQRKYNDTDWHDVAWRRSMVLIRDEDGNWGEIHVHNSLMDFDAKLTVAGNTWEYSKD